MAESRKTVTIVFADVTGSTALGEQTDPETMRRIMERYFEEMRTVLEKHGGTVEKFIGDAVMAVFGIPTVHEDDALRAVRAAAEMRERLASLNEEFARERGIEIAVRTGVNTGEVVAGDAAHGQSFATGDAVNVAARLEQAAAPGEILLGALTYQLVREAVRADSIEPLELKGKAAQVETWRLVEVVPGVPAFTRRIDAPFVGRAADLARLREAYERARDARSCVLVTITGAPGVGKSRLVRELFKTVGEEARVLVGRCLPYGEGITYWPVAEIVHQLAGSEPRAGLEGLLAAEPDGSFAAERVLAAIGVTEEAARTEEIFWAVRVLLERVAREQPVVALLDDIHWAEPTLLDLVEYAAGFAHGPILLVCTARLELFEVHPHWRRADAIELDVLDDADAAALIDALLVAGQLSPSVRGQIKERAEGNPLFVEQMLALAGEEDSQQLALPATVQALLAARLDRLSSEERAVLVRGSVEGRLFHRGAVSALLPEEERDAVPRHLLTLARKEFVRPDESLFRGDDGFRFTHILVRDAAYDAAPKELRAELHERFAAWLEERAGEHFSELDEIVGYHLEQGYRYRDSLGIVDNEIGSLARRAGERLTLVGQRAVTRGDHRAAANLLERAFDLFPHGDHRRLELVPTLGYSLVEAGRLEDARRLHIAAVAEARTVGFETLALRSEIELNQLKQQSDPTWSAAEALELVEKAIPELQAAGDDRGLTRAFELVYEVEWTRGRLDAARVAAERALACAERLGDIDLIAREVEAVGASRWFGYTSLREMGPHLEEWSAWSRRVGHRALEANYALAAGWAAMEQDSFEEGRRLCEEGISQLEELGLTVHAAGQRSHLRWGEIATDPDGVEERMRQAYKTLKGVGATSFLSTTAASLAIVLARRGELAEAERLTHESEETGSADDVSTQVGWRLARAMVFARKGKVADAETLAHDALALARGSEYADMTAIAHLTIADILVTSGRLEDASSAVDAALAIFDQKEMIASAEAVRAEFAELQSGVGSPSQ
jgi:class 3 adenylate cyclase